MRQQLNLLFHALMYYSRIPTGKIDFSEENLTKSFRYFPLVGIIVGGIGAGVFLLFQLVFPHTVSVVGAMVAMVLSTGAIHEDGFSDFFDGFGGGHTKERILAIMRDSTVGVYGVVALVLLFLLKAMLFLSIDTAMLPFVFIAANASSRMMPIVMVNTSQYARVDKSKGMHTRNRTDKLTFIIALLFATLPFIFIPWQVAIAIISLYYLIYFILKKYIEKRINGFTGDVLGALITFCEVTFYLTFLAFC